MSFLKELHKPDILDCIAHLSSDEVFTPPKLVNEMLDMLPQELFKSTETKFLDPGCKSGVFLREIAKRLIEGEKELIPDLEKRIQHIFTNQLYGLAITELTGLLARRSTYCSKNANGEYSICSFSTPDGNIDYSRTEHVWENGKCTLCGANQKMWERNAILETHAYSFIHCNGEHNKTLFKRLRDMKFDVIIGNPPYQLQTKKDDTTSINRQQAIPLYHLFIEQAKRLNPRYITMIIPSRWFSSGMGLGEFRNTMLHDRHIKHLIDFPLSTECFPGVKIEGGVCYFLWDKMHNGKCYVKTIQAGRQTTSCRNLADENSDIFIRFNEALSILEKVQKKKERTFDKLVSSIDPFRFPTNFKDYYVKSFANAVKIYGNKFTGYIHKDQIKTNLPLVNKYKIFISEAYGMGDVPYQVINKPLLGKPNTCCTFTYLAIGPFETEKETENAILYVKTRFFRFLVSLVKNTQHASQKVYQFVPVQDFTQEWTDDKLYKKYGLTKEEINFIESMIKPME